MKRNFNEWFSRFRSNIADFGYYTDFPKVYRNIDEIRVELSILNSLLGSRNIEADFRNILEKYPETLKCIPILLAVREQEMTILEENQEFRFSFHQYSGTVENYEFFMKKSGLFDLIQNHLICSLVDYAAGVEVGLDSNGRKNRGGHLMENLVEKRLQETGLIKDTNYFKEMYLNEIETRWNVDLSTLSNQGKTSKRFDFVVKSPTQIYGIETNFYASSGSKLNETARSYKNLALEAAPLEYFTFVWITDGKGWTNARHNLEETFDVMEHLYSLDDLNRHVFLELFR
ncbi:MAG: restriction endonuclease [Planctomycetaceae bacterium]|nr:restriction endonuclease [Planctomycetaceae bacterium]MBQ2822479.1 type II restriction endonuclease [Thermoguttaceae bacterium]